MQSPAMVDQHAMAWTSTVVSECTFTGIECPAAHASKLWVSRGRIGQNPGRCICQAFVRGRLQIMLWKNRVGEGLLNSSTNYTEEGLGEVFVGTSSFGSDLKTEVEELK